MSAAGPVTAARGAALGLFGKLPGHGDFVRRGLPIGFCGPWDDWIQGCLAVAQRRFAPEWDAAWRRAPGLRFVLDPGVCGPAAAAGAMVASCDGVGRSFPLTVAALRPARAGAVWPAEWLAAAERAARRASAEALDADTAFGSLAGPDACAPEPAVGPGWWIADTGGAAARRWDVASLPDAADFAALLGEPA
jgi:type VI secretion system protein ImpM